MQKDSQILQKQPDSDMWTSLVEDFRVKTSVLPENVKVLRESAPGCGVRCTELYGKLDLNTSSLKIRQLSLLNLTESKELINSAYEMLCWCIENGYVEKEGK